MRKKALGIMVLLLIAGVMLSGCANPVDPEDEYNRAKEYVQNVVTEYMIGHAGSVPPHGDMVNTSECTIQLHPAPQSGYIYAGWVLDLCYLLNYCTECETLEYFPFELPICCYGHSGEEGTNFYTGNCTNPYHGNYIWLVDEIGEVCSVCVGDDCWAHNESGYQGVWP